MGSMEIRDPKREETLPFAESHSFRRRVAPVCGAIPHPDTAPRRRHAPSGAKERGREGSRGWEGGEVRVAAGGTHLDHSAITPPLHSPCARHVRREGSNYLTQGKSAPCATTRRAVRDARVPLWLVPRPGVFYRRPKPANCPTWRRSPARHFGRFVPGKDGPAQGRSRTEHRTQTRVPGVFISYHGACRRLALL